MTEVAATLEAVATADPACHDAVKWPAPFPEIVDPLAATYRRYLDMVAEQPDPDSRGVLLLGRSLMPILALVQFAIWTQGARQSGLRLVGHDTLDYLAGETSSDRTPAPLQAIGQPVPRFQWWWLRRLVRTRSWTPGWRLPKAMVCPDGAAMTHNSLLRNYLRDSNLSIRNAYDSDFGLENASLDPLFASHVDPIAMAEHVAGALSTPLGLADDIATRLQSAVEHILRVSYTEGVELLGRLRSVRRLPKSLYTGTGSKRLSRALGLEISRRGGDVVRCDHGGSFILLDSPDSVALTELSVSTRFVVATRRAAEGSNLQCGRRRIAAFSDCKIEGHRGDPGLDVGRAAFVRSRTVRKERRRVMYVSTVLYGLHQVSPPTMPAPLYLDWQERLIAMLKQMPIDLLCKPHPGGLKPPAELDPMRHATAIDARFEQAVSQADVLVYDFPATTTLAVGLCTDRPIVLVNHGTMRFAESVRRQVESRCRIVETAYDEFNRPVVQARSLEEAICGGPDSVDPGFFRGLFLGES